MTGQEAAIGALGVLVLAGVASRLFLRRTGFSDVFLLLLFGVAAGWALPASSVFALSGLAPTFAAITLLMIILDEGLHLPLEHLKKSAHKAILFALFSFFLSMALASALSYFVLGLDFFLSLLVGAMFGSVAPELLSGFLCSLGASKEAQSLGGLEAVFSDVLCLILSLIFVSAEIAGQAGLMVPSAVAVLILLSVALGSVCAALWRAFLSRAEHENQHLLVIGIAALLYAAASMAGADAVIAVFTFAFFLGNLSHPSIDEMRRFQSEISFFLRTFFFVYLGILLFHSPKPLEIGLFALALSLLLAVSRLLSGRLAGLLEPSARASRLLESVSARGLTSAVLAVVASQELSAAGLAPAIDLQLLALFVVFFTNAISAFMVLRRRVPGKAEKKPGLQVGALVRGGLDSL